MTDRSWGAMTRPIPQTRAGCLSIRSRLDRAKELALSLEEGRCQRKFLAKFFLPIVLRDGRFQLAQGYCTTTVHASTSYLARQKTFDVLA